MTAPIIPTAMIPPTNGGFADNPHRGVASLTFKGRTLRFRTNPNEVWWSYVLNTNVEQTYGGRVVQILSVRIEDLVIKVDCGRGGWAYFMQVVDFLRQMMIDQRKDGGTTATFNYTTRRWRMKVYALSIPFQDRVGETVRELELRFKVQEDVSGIQSQMALNKELARLQEGIGFKKSGYNTPGGGSEYESPAASPMDLLGNLGGAAGGALPGIGGMLGQVMGSLTGGIPGL